MLLPDFIHNYDRTGACWTNARQSGCSWYLFCLAACHLQQQCARELACADGDAYTRLDVRGLAGDLAGDRTPWHSRSLHNHSHCSGVHNVHGRRACSGDHMAYGPRLCDAALWGLPDGACCAQAPPGRLQQVRVRRPCMPQHPSSNPTLDLKSHLGACSRCECGVHARRSTGARPSCASCGG